MQRRETTTMETTMTLGEQPLAERRFYSWYVIGLALLVLAGFSSSFYLPGIVVFPRPTPTLTPLLYVHGVVFTAWMLLFVAQTQLISAGRRKLHMSLGVSGFVLAIVMLVLMFWISGAQVARANHPPFVTALAWSALPYFVIPQFALFLGLGWKYRFQGQVHKRFMLLAALLMMEPAVGRLPLAPASVLGAAIHAALSWLTIVPLMVWDWRTLGRLHWVTALGAVVIGGALVLRFAVWQTEGWAAIAKTLAGMI
jgi:hypothetical protein